ncbi:hypothetical protein C2S51_014120 [Perilla frutescens var. frutescens]|nr:hypothetical protein C2S51_014120 [Perilla frutescens var. frutescens]
MDQKHLISLMTRLSQRRSPLDKKAIQGSRQLVAQNSEIAWSGEARICDKQVNHYPAFCRNKTNIYVHSIVWILGSGERKDYLGYVEDVYENEEGEKMVQVRKFVFRKDIEGMMPKLYPLCKQVFITPIVEQLSAKVVDGVAAVLAPTHFHRCDESLPLRVWRKTFMCCKEFKQNCISAFTITELPGYYSQPLLSYLGYYVHAPGLSSNAQNLSEEAEDSSLDQDLASHVLKRHKRSKVHQTVNDSPAGLKTLAGNGNSSSQRQKTKMSSKVPEREGRVSIKGKKDIELLCHESDMQGCWFRCKILRSSRNRIKVQYYDLMDGDQQLEEWVAASREAAPDKLGMRCGGRLTVRPCPDWDSSEVKLEVGAAVDAWWFDAWWEGIVVGCHSSGRSRRVQVYLTGTGEEQMQLMTVEARNVRASKDWIDNKWVDISPNTHILALIPSTHAH